MDCVPDGDERLERHHRFIVFAEVAANHQDLLGRVSLLWQLDKPGSSLARSHRAWVVTATTSLQCSGGFPIIFAARRPGLQLAVDPVPHRVFR